MATGRDVLTGALLDQSEALVDAAAQLAGRFRGGGLLVAAGGGLFASDAEHIAVEFLHPVVVGSPALPAFAVAGGPDSRGAVDALAGAGDAVVAVGDLHPGGSRPSCGLVVDLSYGRQHHEQTAGVHLPVDDPLAAKEGLVPCYHLLWEITHLFLGGGAVEEAGDLGATASLYPFLSGGGAGPTEAAISSCRAKVDTIHALRTATLASESGRLDDVAAAISAGAAAGGRVLTCGNGGSSADAASLAAALTATGLEGDAIAARSLTADRATVTALANDLGYERVFARQVAALARPGDVLIGLSTSGNSPNLIAAFVEARRHGVATVGFAGYDGGEMQSAGVVDHLFVVGSASVHRIQEAQATLYLELVRRARLAATGGGGAARQQAPARAGQEPR